MMRDLDSSSSDLGSPAGSSNSWALPDSDEEETKRSASNKVLLASVDKVRTIDLGPCCGARRKAPFALAPMPHVDDANRSRNMPSPVDIKADHTAVLAVLDSSSEDEHGEED